MSVSRRTTNMITNSQDRNGVSTNQQNSNISASGFSPNGNSISNHLQSQFAEDEHVELVYTPYVEDEEKMPKMKKARVDDGLDESAMYAETQEALRSLVEFRLMQAAREEEEECYHMYSDDDDHYQAGMLREEYWADGLQEDSDGNFYWGDAEEEEW